MPIFLSHSLIESRAKFTQYHQVLIGIPPKWNHVMKTAEQKFLSNGFGYNWSNFGGVFSEFQDRYNVLSFGVDMANGIMFDGC